MTSAQDQDHGLGVEHADTAFAPLPPNAAPALSASGWRKGPAKPPLSLSRLLPQARLSGPMPWVIAIMIALSVVAAASALSLRNLAQTASAELEGGVTVQIVNASPDERNRQAEQALNVLRKTPGITEASRVEQDELNRLVEPWLGTRTGDEIEALPIPALIDVRLAGPADTANIAKIRQILGKAAPSARVDAQSSWLAPVFAAIGALQWMAAGLIALLAFATASAVLLAARAAIGANRETIEIMHMLGATDGQIAKLFQRSVAVDAVMGGLVGLACGIAAILVLGREFSALGSGMMLAGELLTTDWVTIAAVPLGGVVLAVLTTRLTVLNTLGKML